MDSQSTLTNTVRIRHENGRFYAQAIGCTPGRLAKFRELILMCKAVRSGDRWEVPVAFAHLTPKLFKGANYNVLLQKSLTVLWAEELKPKACPVYDDAGKIVKGARPMGGFLATDGQGRMVARPKRLEEETPIPF